MTQTFSVLQLASLIAEQLSHDVPEAANLPKKLAMMDQISLTDFHDVLRRTLACADPSYNPRDPLPTDPEATALYIWEAAAHMARGYHSLQSLAALYLMDRIGFRLLYDEPSSELTFGRFEIYLDAKRWTDELLGLQSDDAESIRRFSEIRDRLLDLQAKSYRLYGSGQFSFVADSWIQLEWYRATITDEQLLAEGIRKRLRHAFIGLRKNDGKITRPDHEVMQLIIKIRHRMAKRRQLLENLRIAIRGICGLSPNFPIDINIHGNHDRLDRLVSLTVRKIRAARNM